MQRCEKSCVVACIAMVTGRPFEEVECDVLTQGMAVPMIPDAYMDFLVQKNMFPMPVSANAPNPFIFGQLYLVTVASLNHMSGLHMVVIDYRGDYPKVYDPQEGRDGKFLTSDDWQGTGTNKFSWCDLIELYDCSEKNL